MSGSRFDRRSLKRPDSFISFTYKRIDWLRDNAISMAGAVAVVVIIAAATVGYIYIRDSNENAASYQYGKLVTKVDTALELTGAERQVALTEAARELELFYDGNRGADVGGFSLLTIGKVYFSLGRFEQAANAYDQASRTFAKAPNFQAMAFVGAGKSWEAMRQFDKALDAYQRANAIEPNPFGDIIKSDIGRVRVYRDSIQALQLPSATAEEEAAEAVNVP
jgi:tetratricopeptide (TPR) repeat protein